MKILGISVYEYRSLTSQKILGSLLLVGTFLASVSCDPRNSKSKRQRDKAEERQEIPSKKTIRKDLPDELHPIGTGNAEPNRDASMFRPIYLSLLTFK